jgi:GT2 family glycosyltransferase
VSVVVCSYNGSRTIRECCEGLRRLEYPDYEVVVVDDGSTDETASIAAEYGFRVISTENRGLSSARNTGLEAATGEIVAYIDDDAYPDPAWLTHLATSFMRSNHAGVGGPNITPPDDGPTAVCVANSPGNPTHVLFTDEEAEHLPGCNMAFRKSALEAIGGFDTRFRIAGDDVDLCWRIRENGGTLGFSPAAMVWHHRRGSVRTYLKQQMNYGRAEGMLERKWPDKHNSFGHRDWQGRIYGAGLTSALPLYRPLVYHGVWGNAPFQSIYDRSPGTVLSLPLMPEWSLIMLLLSGLSALGILWRPLLLALPLLALSVVVVLIQAAVSASKASFGTVARTRFKKLKMIGLTTLLHLAQPLARLWGRLRADMLPGDAKWRGKLAWPWRRASKVWCEERLEPEARLTSLESAIRSKGVYVVHGGDFAPWDLEARGGLLGSIRTVMAVEEHNEGAQLIRFKTWPSIFRPAGWLIVLLLGLAGLAAWDGAWPVAVILASTGSVLALVTLANCARAAGSYLHGLRQCGSVEPADR